MALSKQDINRLLALLNDQLETQNVMGELYLVGGAVMCLVFEARQSTKDLDGYFKPTKIVRTAASKVARQNGIPDDWLNDAVKGYASEKGTFTDFLVLSNLRVMTATPEYLLAMKCIAMRIGAEFHDESDVRFLIRYLNLTSYETVLSIVTQFYPEDMIPQKTLYALMEILQD